MGSTLSKRASKITPPRKYPLRPPPPPHHPTPAPAQTTRPSENSNQNPATNPSSDHAAPTAEPIDPQYAASLRRLGPVTPPDPFSTTTITPSSSSTSPNRHRHNPPTNSSPTITTTSSSSSSPNRHTNQEAKQQSTSPTPSYLPAAAAQANPALQVLNRRQDIQRAAEADLADSLYGEGDVTNHQKRSFLDVVTLRRVLVLRDRGMPEGEIERELGLRGGLVGRLGPKGVVRAAEGGGGGLLDKA